MKGRPKGSIKTPGSGRKKGSPNKDSLPLEQKARELDVDPFLILLLFAKGDWESLGYKTATRTMCSKSGETYEVDSVTADHRLKAAGEACQYLYPKRKAIQMLTTITDGHDNVVQLNWADETVGKHDSQSETSDRTAEED